MQVGDFVACIKGCEEEVLCQVHLCTGAVYRVSRTPYGSTIDPDGEHEFINLNAPDPRFDIRFKGWCVDRFVPISERLTI